MINRENVWRITDTLVAVACDAAEELGPVAIAEGVRVFVGFAGRVQVLTNPEYDALLVKHLSELASDHCAPDAFRTAFRTACLALSNRFIARARGDPDAHLIAVSADGLRGSVRVIVR